MKLKIFIFLSSIFFFHNELISQNESNIYVGIGLPQGLSLGYRYQVSQLQIGGSVGTLPLGDNEKRLMLSGDIFYHIIGNSKFSSRKKWYTRIGITFFRSETEEKLFKDLFGNLRFGREFNFSKRFGMQFDIGFTIPIFEKEFQKVPPSTINNSPNPIGSAIAEGAGEAIPDFFIYPGMEIVFFYRL